jgi:hypothetical protein
MFRSRVVKAAFGLAVLVMAAGLMLALEPGAAVTPSAGKAEARPQAAPAAPDASCDRHAAGAAETNAVCGACTETAPVGQDEGDARPPRHGYCRCSCGYPCSTSADCGGVSCDKFITCC